jgi:hypothetical protein
LPPLQPVPSSPDASVIHHRVIPNCCADAKMQLNHRQKTSAGNFIVTSKFTHSDWNKDEVLIQINAK